MKKIKSTLLFILLLLTIQFSIAQSKEIEQLKNDYIESAHLNVNETKIPIVKWENVDTLKYQIIGDLKYISQKGWIQFTKEIENLTELKIIETNDNAETHIYIYFGELNDYFLRFNSEIPKQLHSGFDNWHSRKYNSQKQLLEASFCIVPSKTKDSKRGVFNVKKLFLKSLGLLGEVNNENSMFYKHQTEKNTYFMRKDKRIIKIHYNPAIKAGMTDQQVRVALNSIDLTDLIREKL